MIERNSSLFQTRTPAVRQAALVALTAAASFFAHQASAENTYVWTGTTTPPSWNAAANWSLNGSAATTFPKTITDIAEFTGTPGSASSTYNVTSAANQKVDQLYFTNLASKFSIVAASTPDTLSINAGSSTVNSVGLLYDSGSTGAVLITTPLSLASNQAWEIDATTSGAGVTIGSAAAGNGGISGSGNLTKTGPGSLTFKVANSGYSGQIAIAAGTLNLSGSSAGVGSASPILVGATTGSDAAKLLLDTGATLNTDVTAQTGTTGTLTLGSSGDTSVVTYGGTITLNNAVSISASTGGTVNLTGSITGSKGFNHSSAGTVVLTHANTYAGNTSVNAGEVRANNGFANGSATGTGKINIGGGTFGGNGTVTGDISLASGNIGAGAGDFTTGRLAAGNLAASGGSGYVWKINDATGAQGATDGWDDVAASALSFPTLTASAPFTIHLQSLAGGAAGPVANLSSTTPQSWIIAESTGGSISINGVAYSDNEPLTGASASTALAGLFAIDPAGFTLTDGTVAPASSFTLSLLNTGGSEDLQLTYSAVPEPASAALLAIGAVSLLKRRRRD